MKENLFIDPTPVSKRTLTVAEMQEETGGAAFLTICIVACAGTLGAATIAAVGAIGVAIVNKL